MYQILVCIQQLGYCIKYQSVSCSQVIVSGSSLYLLFRILYHQVLVILQQSVSSSWDIVSGTSLYSVLFCIQYYIVPGTGLYAVVRILYQVLQSALYPIVGILYQVLICILQQSVSSSQDNVSGTSLIPCRHDIVSGSFLYPVVRILYQVLVCILQLGYYIRFQTVSSSRDIVSGTNMYPVVVCISS